MHCNLRPSDVSLIVLRFNYNTHTKCEVNLSVPDYAMTLTFDPLALNVYIVSAVTRSDSESNFSDIEHTAEL